MESEEPLKYFIDEVQDASQTVYEEERILDEVELAAEFLNKAGLMDLSQLYQEGREIPERLVKDSLSYRRLTQKQAETIKSRIRTLNKTARNRRRKRQDIREVTWKIEDANLSARSRSADSLNSGDTRNEEINFEKDFLDLPPKSVWDSQEVDIFQFSSCCTISLLSLCSRISKHYVMIPISMPSARRINKWKIKTRTSGNMSHSAFTSLNQKSKSKNLKGPLSREKKFGVSREKSSDIANLGSENVVLKGYHILNENGLPPMRDRSGSDPTKDTRRKIENEDVITEPPPKTKMSKCNSLSTTAGNDQEMFSFEEMVRENLGGMSKENEVTQWKNFTENSTYVEDFGDEDYQYLQPILYVELIAILDQYNITYLKRKLSNKLKGGNVFGVNLSTLIMRDMTGDSSMVPEIFSFIIDELNKRVTEDGILRVAGQKQKLETLCNEIELNYYSNKSRVHEIMRGATTHELTGVLKRLLRDLPDPILTVELCDMFYKTSLITDPDDMLKALNLLVLLLPVQHRRTFKLLLDFLLNVTKHERYNRMNLHNVAMISAPSFFPPRFLLLKDSKINVKELTKEELVKQINAAAVCCSIMEALLQAGEKLWTVPGNLSKQAFQAQTRAQQRREMPGKLKLARTTTQYDSSTKNTSKLKKY